MPYDCCQVGQKYSNHQSTIPQTFINLRSEASFCLIAGRLDQTNQLKEIKNQETIQGME